MARRIQGLSKDMYRALAVSVVYNFCNICMDTLFNTEDVFLIHEIQLDGEKLDERGEYECVWVNVRNGKAYFRVNYDPDKEAMHLVGFTNKKVEYDYSIFDEDK